VTTENARQENDGRKIAEVENAGRVTKKPKHARLQNARHDSSGQVVRRIFVSAT